MLHRVVAMSLILTLAVLLLSLTALPEEPLPFPLRSACASDVRSDEAAEEDARSAAPSAENREDTVTFRVTGYGHGRV